MTSSGSYLNTYTYSYAKAKRAEPIYDRVYVAIYEMDYAINTPYIFGNYFYLYYSLYFNIMGTSGIEINVYSADNMMNQVKVSLLIFDNDFYLYEEIFQPLGAFYLDTNTGNSYSWPVKSSSYRVLRFLTYCDIATSNTNSGTITIVLSDN